MPPSPFSHQNLRRGPARGAFPGSADNGVLARSSAAAGVHVGGLPLDRTVSGAAELREVPEGTGKAACGEASTVQGGKDGSEPFYLQGCGCGGACDAGANPGSGSRTGGVGPLTNPGEGAGDGGPGRHSAGGAGHRHAREAPASGNHGPMHSGSTYTGTHVDIYLSSGYSQAGNPSCDTGNNGGCGLYRVRWNLTMGYAEGVELVEGRTVHYGGGSGATKYSGQIEPALAPGGGLAWIRRDRAADGTETAAALQYRAPGSSTTQTLVSGTGTKTRPQWPWFVDDDRLIFERADGPGDMRTLYEVGTDGAGLRGVAGPTGVNSTGSSYGNPQTHGDALVSFGGGNPENGKYPQPHVSSLSGTSLETFDVGNPDHESYQHPSWSPDGRRVMATRQYAVEGGSSGLHRLLYVFERNAGVWVSQGRLFDAPALSSLPPAFQQLQPLSCSLLTFKYAQWCAFEDWIVVTAFCNDSTDASIPPAMSRVLLVNVRDPAAPAFHDVTQAVAAAVGGLASDADWRGMFSTCALVT